MVGRIIAVVSDEVEDVLREKARKKGDISDMVEKALRLYWGMRSHE